MLGEEIKLAFENFRANKLRTFLSLLGILIGVASVILITTLGESATANIQKDISKEGMDLIDVQKGWAEKPFPGIYSPNIGEQAALAVPGVLKVTPFQEINATILSKYKSVNATVRAIRPAYLNINRLGPVTGTLFPTEEEYYENDEVILGYEAAKSLFPLGKSVGEKIIANYGDGVIRQYQVRAVLAKKGAGILNDYDNIVFLPYETYSRKVKLIREVSGWIFQTRSPAGAAAVSQELTAWFSNWGNDRDAFFILAASSVANMFKSVTGTLKLVLGSIAAISLLVGGVGIMNIMLVSVTERINEIGIRMALGATPGNIRSQFLIEAVCLTVLGGILGISVGAGLGAIAAKIMQWPFVAATGVYLMAAGVSVTVGLFFGLYPAIKASNLDPVAALSRE